MTFFSGEKDLELSFLSGLLYFERLKICFVSEKAKYLWSFCGGSDNPCYIQGSTS
jgi:hypothetical protein